MNLGLVGCGIVGGAFLRWQQRFTKNEVKVYDPEKGYRDDLDGVEAIVICLPAPTMPSRIQDTQAIESTLQRYKYLGVPFFLRSTVTPGTSDRLSRKCEVDVFHMPEFLTERQADEDIKKHTIVCGTPEGYLKSIETTVEKMFPDKIYMVISNTEAEIAKYAHNCFAAVKVNYFNSIFALSRKLGANYTKVLGATFISGFIEPTHTQVPGPDGHYGFGGHCLPKDLTAFIGCLADNQIMNSSLRRVEAENKLNRDFRFNTFVDNNLLI